MEKLWRLQLRVSGRGSNASAALNTETAAAGPLVAPARRERETLVSVEQLGLHTCYTYREVACEKSGRKGRDATPGSHSTS